MHCNMVCQEKFCIATWANPAKGGYQRLPPINGTSATVAGRDRGAGTTSLATPMGMA
jgi:hypothetical protein